MYPHRLICWYGACYAQARREHAECRAMDIRDDLVRLIGWALGSGHPEALGALKDRRARGAAA